MALMEKAATACPLCHNKRHGLIKCGYGLRAGYVTKHNPEKAKARLETLDLSKGRRAKPDNNPSARLSQATSPAPPSQPAPQAAPQASPSSPPPPTQSISEDVDEVIAASAEAMKGEEEDIAGAFSLSDNDESLVEAGDILSREECERQGNWTSGPNSLKITKTSVAPPYLLAPVPSTLPLASACAAIVANQDASLSPTNLPPVMKSVVTLFSPTIYKMAAAFLQRA